MTFNLFLGSIKAAPAITRAYPGAVRAGIATATAMKSVQVMA